MKNSEVGFGKIIGTLILAGGLAACGGGGGSSDTSAATGSTSGSPSSGSSGGGGSTTAPTDHSAAIRSYGPGEVSQENAEALVKESVKILEEIARNAGELMEELEPIDESQLVEQDLPQTVSLSELMCDRGGSASITYEQGRPQILPNRFSYFGTGDQYRIERRSCVSSQLFSPWKYEGYQITEVLSGYFDWFDEFGSEEAEVKQTFHQFGVFGGGLAGMYIHGDSHLKLTGGKSLTLTGESLKVKTQGYNSTEYGLGSYEMTVNKVEGLPSYRSAWSLTSPGVFNLGLGTLGLEFQAQITDGIIHDTWMSNLQGGTFLICSEGRTLEVEIFASHLMYRLDLDGDSVFETEAMLDDSEY